MAKTNQNKTMTKREIMTPIRSSLVQIISPVEVPSKAKQGMSRG